MAAAAHQALDVGSPPCTGTSARAPTTCPVATGARAETKAANEEPSASRATAMQGDSPRPSSPKA
eukprot:10865619-Alexandrium_andersonii.AAC.1